MIQNDNDAKRPSLVSNQTIDIPQQTSSHQQSKLKQIAKVETIKFKQNSKIFLLRHQGKLIASGLLIVLIIFLILIFKFLSYLFTQIGAGIICVLSVLALIRFIAVVSTFPGSFWFFKREVQLQFNIEYCSRLNLVCEKLIKFIQIDLVKKPLTKKYRLKFSQMQNLIQEISQLYEIINEHRSVFQRLIECNKISPVQQQFYKMLEDLRRIIKHRIKFQVIEINQLLNLQENQSKIYSLQDISQVEFNQFIHEIHLNQQKKCSQEIEPKKKKKQNERNKIHQGFTLTFTNEDSDQMIEKLLDLLRVIHSQTFEGMKEQSNWEKMKLYLHPFENIIFKNVLFGQFDYMRADLEANNSGQQFWVNSFDNSKIDCMIIPSDLNNLNLNKDFNQKTFPFDNQSLNLTQNSEIFSDNEERRQNNKILIDNQNTNFILFCNPNACYYEYLKFQAEWLNFYTKILGLNIIVFNYRGYGRSNMSNSNKFLQKYFGLMNPQHVMQDAEVVLEYAVENFILDKNNSDNLTERKNYIKSKIMIHGESLGGMVAAYVTMKSNSSYQNSKNIPIDFAFINRTFSSLDNVAFWASSINLIQPYLNGSTLNQSDFCLMNRQKFAYLLGSTISKIFRFVTQWKDQTWLNYAGIEKQKYCLFGCDPINDHIINDLPSLKSANSREIIYNQLGIPHNLKSKYSLCLNDYILKDDDLLVISQIFEKWSLLLRRLKFIILNQKMIQNDLEDQPNNQSVQIESKNLLQRQQTLTFQTEENVKTKFDKLNNLLSNQDEQNEESSNMKSEMSAQFKSNKSLNLDVLDSHRINKKKIIKKESDSRSNSINQNESSTDRSQIYCRNIQFLNLDPQTYILKQKLMNVINLLKNQNQGISFNNLSQSLQYLEKTILGSCLSQLNAAGKPLSELIQNSKCQVNIKEEIRMFLANLEIYGSLQIKSQSEYIRSTFISDYYQCRLTTLQQLESTLKNIENTINSYSSLNLLDEIVQNDMVTLYQIIQKIQKVFQKKNQFDKSNQFGIFQIGEDEDASDDQSLKQNVQGKHSLNNHSLNSDEYENKSKQDDDGKVKDHQQIIFEIQSQSTLEQSALNIDDQNLGIPAFSSLQQPDIDQVGHYIFLRCGHNGLFNENEKQVFIQHLQRAGIINQEIIQRYSLISQSFKLQSTSQLNLD